MNITGKTLSLNSQSPEFFEVLALDQAYFPHPWSKVEWGSLNWKHHQLFGLEVKDKLEGFALFGLVDGDDTAHLLKICLHPGLRGAGVSSTLFQACCQSLKTLGAKTVFLEVESHNHTAIGFYQKQRFITLKVTKGFYSDGTDALIMQLTL